MQSFRIIWSDEKSRAFCVQKSVRQGGVLSPYFFNLYMDGLEEKLDASGLGCWINGSFVNNIWYADDLVLLAPSIFASVVICPVKIQFCPDSGQNWTKWIKWTKLDENKLHAFFDCLTPHKI